jgi:hypothetical protein
MITRFAVRRHEVMLIDVRLFVIILTPLFAYDTYLRATQTSYLGKPVQTLSIPGAATHSELMQALQTTAKPGEKYSEAIAQLKAWGLQCYDGPFYRRSRSICSYDDNRRPVFPLSVLAFRNESAWSVWVVSQPESDIIDKVHVDDDVPGNPIVYVLFGGGLTHLYAKKYARYANAVWKLNAADTK